MKTVFIEVGNNGYKVTYENKSWYIYRSIDDLAMLEEVAEKFLDRKVKIIEK